MNTIEILISLSLLFYSYRSAPPRVRRWIVRGTLIGLAGLIVVGTLAIAWLLISPPSLEAAEARPLRDGLRIEGVVRIEDGGLTFIERDKAITGAKGGLSAETVNGPEYNKVGKDLLGRHFKAVADRAFHDLVSKKYEGELTVQVRALTCNGLTRLLVEGWSHRADARHVACRPATTFSEVNITATFDGQETLTFEGEDCLLLPNRQLEKLRKKWTKKDYESVSLRGEWIPLKEGRAFLITRIGRYKRSSS